MQNVIIGILLVAIFILIISVNELKTGMEKMNLTLYRLSKEAGVIDPSIDEELRNLIKEGKRVKAIKKVREAWGFSLLDAKKYVDNLK